MGKIELNSQVWWCKPIIPALRRLTQEDLEFHASLSQTNKVLGSGETRF
jgi:hypothetical protein